MTGPSGRRWQGPVEEIFRIEEPDASFIGTLLDVNPSWRPVVERIRDDLNAMGIHTDTALGGGAHTIAFSVRDSKHSVVRLGMTDYPVESVTVIQKLWGARYLLPTDNTIRVEREDLRDSGPRQDACQVSIVPFVPDALDMPGVPKQGRYGGPMDIQQDIKNTLTIMQAEGIDVASSLADGGSAGHYAYMVNPYTGKYLCYPEQGVPPEFSGRPIAFVRDYNAFLQEGHVQWDNLRLDSTSEADIRHMQSFTGLVDGDSRQMTPEEFRMLKFACSQQDYALEEARHELREMGVEIDFPVRGNRPLLPVIEVTSHGAPDATPPGRPESPGKGPSKPPPSR